MELDIKNLGEKVNIDKNELDEKYPGLDRDRVKDVLGKVSKRTRSKIEI